MTKIGAGAVKAEAVAAQELIINNDVLNISKTFEGLTLCKVTRALHRVALKIKHLPIIVA
ncbi:hypothetical protein RCC89_15960 [Cytophagaceae bacterium ABcell3]|nr:hypothetical protein RCC89_15960 [Cytophagaceae bacterium ABcell3]